MMMLRRGLMGNVDPLQEFTATGNPATFLTNIAKPLAGLLIPFSPVQTGTGDPAPDNVRPITGWTGLNIYHSGEDTSNPDTIPVSWQTEAGTVYGGMLDALTGVLTVTHYLFTIDKTTYFVFGQGFNSNYRAVYYLPENGKIQQFSNCNMFRFRAYNNAAMYYPDKGKISAYPADSETDRAVFGLPDGITNENEWRSYIETNGNIQIAYELAEPFTVQLDPATLSTLIGENVVWTDTNGTNTIKYLKMN